MHTYLHTIREWFVPSPPTPRTLQTPHVTDFFLFKLRSARHLFVRVIKETVALALGRDDVDPRTGPTFVYTRNETTRYGIEGLLDGPEFRSATKKYCKCSGRNYTRSM